MLLPISKNQARKLGSRLREAAVPTEEDLDLVQRVLEAYDDVLRSTSERLWHDLGITSSGRLKNLGTIVEKLQRESGTNLAGIQDIAGRRIVLDQSARRSDQDRIRDVVVAAFAEERAPRVYDRRETPSRGYRAVHVIVTVDDLPVEIQIRTHWQQRWAELFEKMGDQFGRGIRYDAGEPNADRLLGPPRFDEDSDGPASLTKELVDWALTVADLIATLESLNDDQAAMPAIAGAWAAVDRSISLMTTLLDVLRRRLEVDS